MANINGPYCVNVTNHMASYNTELGAIEKEMLHMFIRSSTGTRWTINDMHIMKKVIVQLASSIFYMLRNLNIGVAPPMYLFIHERLTLLNN